MKNSLGRCTRTEYWTRAIIISVIGSSLRYIQEITEENGIVIFIGFISLLLSIYYIIWGVKRMHDVNKSGWYILVPIYNFILAVTPGTKGPNDYGEDPKTSKIEEDEYFYEIIFSFLFASFISCASYAILSETHLVDCFPKSEVIKNTVLIVSFVASLILFLALNFRKKDMNRNETSPQHTI